MRPDAIASREAIATAFKQAKGKWIKVTDIVTQTGLTDVTIYLHLRNHFIPNGLVYKVGDGYYEWAGEPHPPVAIPAPIDEPEPKRAGPTLTWWDGPTLISINIEKVIAGDENELARLSRYQLLTLSLLVNELRAKVLRGVSDSSR